MDDIYAYLVERKSDGEKFVMLTNLDSRNWMNIGMGKYLFRLVSPNYEYGVMTPYGMRNNVTSDTDKYNTRQYRVLHCTKIDR
jgi:hypothetical protein